MPSPPPFLNNPQNSGRFCGILLKRLRDSGESLCPSNPNRSIFLTPRSGFCFLSPLFKASNDWTRNMPYSMLRRQHTPGTSTTLKLHLRIMLIMWTHLVQCQLLTAWSIVINDTHMSFLIPCVSKGFYAMVMSCVCVCMYVCMWNCL